ncbi:kinesin-like protein KIN-4C isoform X1 [Coffea arabica]|uniref:Kinesin-like protein KIN-4C isoform X1 n=1 Tax=Coffea arabica TaxID=13443 RepID=A0ABM4VZR4_COFAR
MDSSEVKDTSQCVRVAVNVRPLVTHELVAGCTDCITAVPGEPQVQIGSHAFTFDYVFGSAGLSSSRIFDECVAPLVDALFHGYNGTVLAYGQTGSGKTYTMGTNYNGEDHKGGVIPKVMETIFSRVEAMKASTEFLIRVSFIEIFKEEVFDLLDPNPPVIAKGDGASIAKPGPARAPIQIRETVNGGITLAGVTEAEVRTKEEMASYLLRGSVSRATGSTNMNSQSSRSHAIFTISMEQKRTSSCSSGDIHDEFSDEILGAKLHLVDLAGSERAKRTGADGMRLKEGIHINKGLLALGNVISALGDDKKRKEGGHVPYRDSKLTRLLQDSLGGNSKTVMIACISPADTNAEETLNTLKYANRARNIQNKAIINRDPMATQMQRMKNQIEQLQAELLFFRGDCTVPFEELQILKHKISLLEASNAQLQQELQERRITCDHLTQRALDAQVERDRLVMKIESARSQKSWNEIDSDSNQDFDLLKGYVSKIQELEGELLRLQSANHLRQNDFVDYVSLDDSGLHSKDNCFAESETKADNLSGVFEDEQKEREHSSLQEKLDMELKELDKRLEQKEAEMKRFANPDTSTLKQHYDKKIQELELEKRFLQKEIEELRHNLANISSTTDDSAQKLKEDYLQKLNVLEAQVVELKKKQDAQAQLLRQKQKSDEAAKRLQDEIQRIKTQKVQLQQKIKQESEQFRLWKASREKEVLQLKKEGRRNEYELHKLLALNQRQKMVLQRKTEEAALATKRLKELLESRKASRELSGVGNSSGPGIQALMQAIEHELEVTVRVHEVRAEYERQIEERTRMAREVAELKEEAQITKQGNLRHTMSPGARDSRIFALENMLATSSSSLVSMASHLSEAEERERAFSGRGRWKQVRSLAEAKDVMNFLFNLASSSRCQLMDREVYCREKDAEIRDLKEKVVKLVRQIELQKADLLRQEKFMKLAAKKPKGEAKNGEDASKGGAEGHIYDLRPKGIRQSVILNGGWNNLQSLEDMDTSDSEYSDNGQGDDDHELGHTDLDDPEWSLTNGRRRRAKKRNSKNSSHSGTASHPISASDSEGLNTKTSGGEDSTGSQKYESAICCSCSKKSLCKTMKCECRLADGICGTSCGCDPVKCSNRESALTQEDNGLPPSEIVGLTRTASETDEADGSHVLASHGAMLLQSALSEKPMISNDEGGPRRKPLSDIGNTLAKSNAPKPNQRKKWRKSTIQLVPAPPPAAEPENVEGSVKPEISSSESDISLKLPRFMRSAFVHNNPLRERNSDAHSDSTVMKEIGVTASRSPQEQSRTTDEKENNYKP